MTQELREKIFSLFDEQGSFDDNRPDAYFETWSPGHLVSDIEDLIAQETRKAHRAGGVDELQLFARSVAEMEKGETWEAWAWRVPKYLEGRIRELKEQDNG